MTDKPDGKRWGWGLIIMVLLCTVAAATWHSLLPTRSTAVNLPPAVNLSPEEAEIVEIAKHAIGNQHDWTFDKPTRNPDGSWKVFAQTFPAMTGGHCTVIIDSNRKVTKNHPRHLAPLATQLAPTTVAA
jgi:hypothetical protein